MDDLPTAQGCQSLLWSSLGSVMDARVGCPGATYPAFLYAPLAFSRVPNSHGTSHSPIPSLLLVEAPSRIAHLHLPPPSELLLFSDSPLPSSLQACLSSCVLFVLWVPDKMIRQKKKKKNTKKERKLSTAARAKHKLNLTNSFCHIGLCYCPLTVQPTIF